MANYKILQVVFERLNIAENVEVNKLIKGRPLDNLEFLQWMKCYYDTTTGGASARESGEGGYYDAEERRAHARGGAAFGAGEEGERDDERTRTRRWWTTQGVETRDDNARGVIDGGDSGECADGASARAATGGAMSASSARTRELAESNAALVLQVERAEQEREFYFEKLQDVEYVCQRAEFERNPLTKVIERILYHTDGKADVDAIIAECFETEAATEKSDATAPALVTTEKEDTAPVVKEKETPSVSMISPAPEIAAVVATSMENLTLERVNSADNRVLGASPLGTPPPMFDDSPKPVGSPKTTTREPLQDADANARPFE